MSNPTYPIVGRNPVVCGRKFCAGCGRWRLACDFAAHRREPLQLNARCHACVRIAYAHASEREREQRREYARKYAERKRREAGVPEREKYTAARIAAAAPILGRRNCYRCGRWRPVSDFGHHRGAMAATCMVCVRRANKASKARRTPQQIELRREYERIYREAQRRRNGVPERNWRTRQAPPDPDWNGNGLSRRVDSAALRPHVRAWINAYAADHGLNGTGQDAGTKALAEASTVAERRIWGILHGEHRKTHYAVADRLCTAMGLTLALIYDDD